MSEDLLTRPKPLTKAYELLGPDNLYITGDLKSARTATDAWAEIGHFGDYIGYDWPLLDRDLHTYSDIPKDRFFSRRRQVLRENHSANLLEQGIPEDRHELLVVGNRPISTEVAFLLGNAVANDSVEKVYFLGRNRSLGALATTREITVIQNPLEVFRWQHPEGAFQRVTSS